MVNFTNRWRVWILVFGIWTMLAVFFTLQTAILQEFGIQAKQDLPALASISLGEFLRLNLAEFYIWAVLAPAVFLLGRRFPFAPGQWKKSLGIHVLACLLIAMLQTAISVLINQWLRTNAPKPLLSMTVFKAYAFARFNQNLLFYWAILGVYQAINYYRKFRERELRASQLQSQLAQAQLKMLKMQLHPHFLFNTLNAISALMYQDVELAERMIARLAELLRKTLENADRQEVPLREELEFIEPYLEIEKARFGPRLSVHVSVDPETINGLVPNMILQPLVENAIRHGIAPRQEPGLVEISAHRDDGRLKLRVRDNGAGISTATKSKSSGGLGLANTRARLQQLYGLEHDFELSNGSHPGFEVAVSIPYHESAENNEPLPGDAE